MMHPLLTRVKRKALRELRNIIPYNHHYQPRGFYTSAQQYDYLICPAKQAHKNRTKQQVSNENLRVDLGALEKKINGLLATSLKVV